MTIRMPCWRCGRLGEPGNPVRELGQGNLGLAMHRGCSAAPLKAAPHLSGEDAELIAAPVLSFEALPRLRRTVDHAAG